MAAKKKAAPKKATTPEAPKTKKPRKQKTSSAPGEAAKAHAWLMEQVQQDEAHADPFGDADWLAKKRAEPKKDYFALARVEEPTSAAPKDKLAEEDTRPRFVKGGRPGPGRPKGSRNKFAEQFIADFYQDWMDYGVSAIQVCREEKIDVYMRTAVAIVPKVMDVRVSELEEMNETQIDEQIKHLRDDLDALMGAAREVH